MDGSNQNGSSGIHDSTSSGGMSRAERFEDEKRRIVDSCFAKKEEDGTLSESYITHIRIVEDAAYPSTPPPPNANSNAKKPRIIIIAVRKSGRVRMHKARENANGTFSIGKTWMLDDLSSVQSYNFANPGNPEEQQQKEWAGGVGFTVTIGKPYYWQANTPKEKQFFIASLVKIYTKYTGGKSPELIGFESREREQLLGSSGRPPPASQPPPQQAPPGYGRDRRRDPSREPPLPQPPLPRTQPIRDAVQRPPPPMPPGGGAYPQNTRPQARPQRGDSSSGSMEANNNIPQQVPQNLRRLAGNNQSQESFGRIEEAASLPPRSRGGVNGLPSAPGRLSDRTVTPISQRTVTPDSSFSGNKEPMDEVPPIPAPLALPPERRRPPMPNPGDSRQRRQNPNDNIVPAPLSSAGVRREDLRPPTRSSERSVPRERDQEMDGSNMQLSSNAFPKAIPTPTATESSDREDNVEVPPAQVPAVQPSPPASVDSPPAQLTEEPEDMRPGLGPMIKSKKSPTDVAGQVMRAAKVANAFSSFKPRAGGAAERLREAQAKSPEGPDGVTGVVPAPSLLRGMSSESATPTPSPVITPLERPPSRKTNDSLPEVKISVPEPPRPHSFVVSVPPVQEISPPETSPPEKAKAREAKRARPPAETMSKELTAIGVDPSIIGDRGGELVSAWEEFGWVGEGIRTKNIDQMKEDVERELNKIQAGGWLSRLEEEDDRIEAIKTGLDRCIEECEELDGLFTLYLVELGTLNEDVAYIEAQSQGLQVQTANQRLLQTELKSLLDTISISNDQLADLREASLESSRGLEQIESSLIMLYKAMLTIDPSLNTTVSRPSEDGSLISGKPGGYGNSEIGSMRVLQEKKDVYKNEIAMFLRRLKPFLQVKFGAAIDETRKALEQEKGSNLTRPAGKARLDPRNHDLARDLLWRYSPLMLFSREVDRTEWEELMKMYEMVCRPVYSEEFKDATFAWKRIVRKPTGDEGDVLFTSQIEKQTDGIATTARKLTVKRSQTLAKSLRSPIGDNAIKSSLDKADGRLQPYEVFAGILDETVSIISMEQNFLVEFFHVTSLEQSDFSDAVSAAPPDMRRGGDLRRPRVMDPDRNLARLVIQSMEELFSFYGQDMQGLSEWTLGSDPLQVIGVIAAIERKLVSFEESSQEFLARTLQRLHVKLVSLFNKLLDEQIRAIEETKVKIKKRKGVIAFIRIFPSFSLTMETMLSTSHDLDIRQTVNTAYSRINKTMFESLKVIARENPSAQVAGADPEDKEALNYQVLLIENMNHYLEEVDGRANPVLEEWRQNATREMNEHMGLYLGAVIRRPLGKLLDFLESAESLMLSRQAGEPATKISSMPSHSKSTFNKILANYDSKEIRKGIEALKKRVEKHFGDADEPGISRGLVATVTQNCEKYYERVEDRILTISRDVYDGEVIAEWTRADVSAAFRK
ncbi:exocyst complex component Sec3 [Drepanopeziza brunnea f. sp. 'multigermtubi' MB_m1]|uniref:Exocyst complex component Sec3 n=1 Tax=Marssonina brunnea f. sp. multigermtubi (strain MB_m1) TaxID=1072389 RepID=K1X5I5_MARBU|nr:exocyst complex component Sec3 [Drepanopeziza brunnea f. sp. 'multigermtubi' MB_m1]EKD20372.1 exocyst complex component Sec3 [Drepanopeziza brunnea f. sp. 'multigermtubi' MB_m1]